MEQISAKQFNESALEETDMITLAEALDRAKVLWFHCPNEGKHKPQYRKKLAALGVKPGVPDVLIFDPPPKYLDAAGAAIELKRLKGGKISSEQEEWGRKLQEKNWAYAVCYGIDQALAKLKEWGYLK